MVDKCSNGQFTIEWRSLTLKRELMCLGGNEHYIRFDGCGVDDGGPFLISWYGAGSASPCVQYRLFSEQKELRLSDSATSHYNTTVRFVAKLLGAWVAFTLKTFSTTSCAS